mgnify:CR=1 FL=1
MARKKTTSKSVSRSNPRKSKTKKVVKRKKSTRRRQIKRGGMQGPWNFDAMGPEGFQQPHGRAVPAGPLTECETLECRKRRAEVALETAKEELESITLELNNARDRESMNQVLIPLQNALDGINNITSNAMSYSSRKLSREGKRLGLKGKRAIGKTAAKTAKRVASLAAANLPLTPEDRRRLLGFQESAERFDRSLDN